MKRFLRLLYTRLVQLKFIRDRVRPSKSKDDLHRYWQQPPSGVNQPEQYAQRSQRSEFLLEVVQKYIAPRAEILEIGCNVGRNLQYLYQADYRISGIEISASAVDAMRTYFPALAEAATIYIAPVETAITQFRDNQFDLVFTMAVLEHIHSDSEWVFQEMVRISREYIITIEDEGTVSDRHFPRDYGRIFRSLGMKQIEEGSALNRGFNSDNFRYRIFEKS